MSNEKVSFLTRLSPLWRGLDLFRKVILNIVFFVVLILVLSILFGDSRPVVPHSTALVIEPEGIIVEQLTTGTPGDLPKQIMGMTDKETLLKDMLDAIDAARDDRRVKVLVLALDGLGGAGLTRLQDMKEAVTRFKKSGKKVIASADNYSRDSYYLAALADEVYMHKDGMLILQGYGHFSRFFKEAIDKLEIDMNIFRVGKYKSAVEPFLRTDMSEEAREANSRWLGVLWDYYLKDVAAARGTTAEAINEYMDQFTVRLKELKGDTAQLALKAGLIDHAVTRDQVRNRLIELVGEDRKKHSYRQINHADYLAALDTDRERWGDNVSGDAIGVIVASGSILNGSQPEGAIGGDSTADLIREARKNKKIKAIVLRVDSGGGSAFASEVIRRELELARQEGKPVVSSMGMVAASGGYWITMASDEVWAYPTTISGSIGIFGMFPTYQKPLAKHLGIRVDGVGTNKLAGGLRSDRELNPEFGDAIQQIIEKGYDDFISMVAAARKMSKEKVDEIAQGRVWAGADAYELGLVDKLGGFKDALDSAAKLAKLGDNYKIKYIRKKRSFREELISKLFSEVTTASDTGTVSQLRQPLNPLGGLMQAVLKQGEILSRFNDPNGIYAYWTDGIE